GDSPPPCGEGSGVGGAPNRNVLPSPPPPPPPPPRGGGGGGVPPPPPGGGGSPYVGRPAIFHALSPHRFAHEIVCRLAQDVVGCAAAIHQLLPDLQEHRHRQRRHVVEGRVA